MSYPQGPYTDGSAPPPAPTQQNWFGRHKIWTGVIGVTLVLGVIGAIQDGAEKDLAEDTVASPSVSTPAATAGTPTPNTAAALAQTAAADAQAKLVADKAALDARQDALDARDAQLAKKEAADAKAAATKKAAAKKAKAKAESESVAADAVNFKMPNFVGMNLQSAQDKVQTLGIFYSVSHDLEGGRSQLIDSNWQVCEQSPRAGSLIKGSAGDYEGQFDFGTVRVSESCP
jgi:hypothetical protein